MDKPSSKKPPLKKALSIAFLFDDTLDSNDGVAQYVKALGSWLTQNGHQVSYLVGESKTSQWDGGKVYALSKNLRLAWGGNRVSISLIPRMKLINRVLKNNSFDVVHVQVPYSPFMAKPVINRLPNSTAVVGTFHIFPANWVSDFGSKVLRILYGKSLNRFDELISVSPAARTYSRRNFAKNSIVLPNVVDIARFQTKRQNSFTNQRIVFLGRLVPRKGAEYLLRAFAKLAASQPETELIIAGGGPQKYRLEALARQLKINNSVKFLGFIPEADKPALLNSATIACFPALYGESFGIVLIEAMAAGAGVVLGGDNEGYRSVMGEQPITIINPKGTEDFAKRLENFLVNKELRNKIYKWQQEEVKKYDVNYIGPKLLKLYHQAIVKRAETSDN